MRRDQLISNTLKNHNQVTSHKYTFDYKYRVFTGIHAACEAFILDLKQEFISHRVFAQDGSYADNGEPIYLIWI